MPFKRGNVQRLELKALVSKKGTIYVQGHEPCWISPPKTWRGEHRKCKSANTTPDVRLPRLCRHQLRNRMLENVFVILLFPLMTIHSSAKMLSPNRRHVAIYKFMWSILVLNGFRHC